MGIFGTRKRGRVTSEGESAIRLVEADGHETDIDIARLEWLSFLQIGDESSFIYEGWWLFGLAHEAVAVLTECGAIDPLMRDGPLSKTADRVADKTLVFLGSLPAEMRGSDAKGGIVRLTASDGHNIRNLGTHESVRSVCEFPKMV